MKNLQRNDLHHPGDVYLCVSSCPGAAQLLTLPPALFRWDQCNRPAHLQPSAPGPQVQV